MSDIDLIPVDYRDWLSRRATLLKYALALLARAAKAPHLEGGRKALRLVDPVLHHRGRRHHEGGDALGAREHQGEGLEGLAEAHVIGEADAGAALEHGVT